MEGFSVRQRPQFKIPTLKYHTGEVWQAVLEMVPDGWAFNQQGCGQRSIRVGRDTAHSKTVKIRAVQTLSRQAHDHSSRGEGFLWASSTQEDAKI